VWRRFLEPPVETHRWATVSRLHSRQRADHDFGLGLTINVAGIRERYDVCE
jgi:hypothetical protein